MDMRAKKTNRSIKNAFLQLRARKPVERITVKELSELAEISKATFYLHYQDIFDLSEQMEYEVIQNIIADVVGSGIDVFDTLEFSRKMHASFSAHQVLINTLFSGGQSAVLPLKIEQGVKEEILKARPELAGNARFNVLISYQVHGTYQAYIENYKELGEEAVLQVLKEIASHIKLIGY